MDTLIPTSVRNQLQVMIASAKQVPNAEFEAKVLVGLIQTKDVADRMVQTIESITVGGMQEEHRATFAYSDGLRVIVQRPENIYKLCSTSSFRGIPLQVERKKRFYEDNGNGKDVLDIPELKLRMTLRKEEPLRKDFSGAVMDPANHMRLLHRKSWMTADRIFRIDMALVKTKQKKHKTIQEVLAQTPSFEVEIELVDKNAPVETIMNSFYRTVEPLLASFQESPFLLLDSDLQRYAMEFETLKIRFICPVNLEKRQLRTDTPHNILTGYTVTNKADGERSILFVARDRRLIRITRSGKISWTGLTATKDIHIGDVIDGEYLADRNLFCIFDVYSFRGKSTQRLPLMTTDDDVVKQPTKSRLGCAHLFLDDIKKNFTSLLNQKPLRIETKLFLSGDGPVMEKAIQTLLDTKFEYETDGLIFTPKSSPVAPISERKNDAWLYLYKWKPSDQNSIDFLVRYKPGESYDPILQSRVFRGTLYVTRNPGSDIIYPCETITGEYTPPQLPDDLRVLAETRDGFPSPFQPSVPKAPDAHEILLQLNERGIPVDKQGQKIDDNTIIECSRDINTGRWIVMRTRYDKTYQYRVLGEPQFGNGVRTAESVWTNMHNPITEEMLRTFVSTPPDDTIEDDLYYRDALESRERVLRDVYAFHNKIKDGLYHSSVKAGDTLLELAVGRGGDMHKWIKAKPSKVVGIDISKSNLESPKQGACVRYIREKAKVAAGRLPPALFIVADMTQPLLQQEERYLKILNKEEPASTSYLEQFVGLTEFDDISCQFAIHYACESEETFRTFVGNLTRHGTAKSIFFGTCMDGQSVYSLLLGKTGHIFRADSQVFGEFVKEYADGDGWTEEFGKAITVKLESFEKPMREYLVPFGKVTEIMQENGYKLMNTTPFTDHYAQQSQFTFSGQQQSFSFLHRSFVFQRTETVEKPEVEEEKPRIEEEKPQPEEKKEEEPEKPKRKIVKASVEKELPDIVFFFSGNPALNENQYLSNMYEAPIQVDGITFPTVEHYFQWSKAKMFGDSEMETKILKTSSPKSVKAYGDKVKDFKEEEWSAKKDNIMRIAVKAKFTQHPELRKKLADTAGKPIAEANPRDKYWGVGTSSDTSKAKDPSKWPGKNVLGKILEEIRSELKE